MCAGSTIKIYKYDSVEYYFVSRTQSLDVEPLYTFRKHLSPVLCVAINATGEECYSGCQDGHIFCWNVPSANIDPYDSYGMQLNDCRIANCIVSFTCDLFHNNVF